ncbi:ERVV2 protein, partial [Jacana jacana]|nr:ERVV2 protein [Jacana jacana]
LAKEGGLCTVIHEHCCTDINQDKRIEKDPFQIWEKTKILHEVAQDDTSWGPENLMTGLTSWLPNLTWLKQLFIIMTGLVVLFIVFCITAQCALWCRQNTGSSCSDWKRNQ